MDACFSQKRVVLKQNIQGVSKQYITFYIYAFGALFNESSKFSNQSYFIQYSQAMKSNSTSFLHSQEKIIKQPLISSLYDSSPENQTIDVMKLMNKQQQSRVTKVDIKSYRSIARSIPNNTLLHQKSVIQNINEPQEEQTQNVQPKKQREFFLQNRTTQTFLSNYENNSLFGFGLYLAFMAFISAEVLTSTYFASQSQNIAFYKNKGILLILFSQLVYYLIMRVLNTKVSIKIYSQSSISHSIKNLLLFNPNNKIQKDSENSLTKFFKINPSITIAITILSILSSQIIYYRIATQVSMLFEKGSIDLISTLFWSNFVVPVLVRHFCLNQERSWKMQVLPYLVGVFVLSLLFQSTFVVVLAVLKILQAYLQSILGVQMFHFNQLSKTALFMILGTLNIVYILRGDSEDVFKQNILKECVVFCVELAVITLSFILSRVIAAVYLKNQLHRYFYTQSHIIVAYLFTTILIYCTYLNFVLWHSILAICLLLVMGVIIYLEGKQKEELTIQISLEQQQT